MHVATITIDHTKVAGDLTDYVVAVITNSDAGWAELYATAVSGGGDVRVYKAGGTTELPREAVSLDLVGETGEIHVKYTGTLSGSVDTDIEIHADGTSSDYAVGATYGRNAVWTDYYIVMHMDDATDSTGNNTPTAQGGITAGGATGKLGSATNFDGSTEYFNLGTMGSAISGVATGTVQAWMKTSDTNFMLAGLTGGAGAFQQNVQLLTLQTDRVAFYNGDPSGDDLRWEVDASGKTIYTNNTFNKVTSVIDITADANNKFYINGTDYGVKSVRGASIDATNAARDVYLGGINNGGFQFPYAGDVDEFRMSSMQVSANWESTEEENQSSPSTFYSVVAETGITQALTASATGAATVATTSTFGLTLNAAAGVAAMIEDVKSLTRTLTGSATGSATINTANLIFKTISAAASATVSIATEASQGVLMIANAAVNATVNKTVSATRSITGSATAQATVNKTASLYRTLTGSATAQATINATKTFFETMTATVSATATVVKSSLTLGLIMTATVNAVAKLGDLFYKKKYTKDDEDYKRKY